MKPLRSYLAELSALLVVTCTLSCSNSAPPISVALSASSAQTDQGKSITITATLTNDKSGRGVTWSLSGPGSLSAQFGSTVTYTAPGPSNTSTVQTATVAASSVADPTKTASLQVSVNPPPFITALSLFSANQGAAYKQSVSTTGGTQPFAWSIVYGALPPGLSLGSSSGTITGTPTAAGTWYFEVQLADAAGWSAQQPFLSIEVYPGSTVANPVPFVSQPLVPDAVAPGGSAVTITLNGAGFLPGSTVNLNGAALATSFVNKQQLTAVIPAANIATATTAFITVVNPTPGGGRSNAVFFPVAEPQTAVNFVNAAGSPITAYDATSVAVGDFNQDGKADLAFAYNVRVATLLGNGDGTFAPAPGSPITVQQPPWDTLPTPYIASLALGDFNNSGKLGIAAAGLQNMNVTILEGNGDGSFTASSAFAYTEQMSTQNVVAADFNGDGNLDLVTVGDANGLPLVLLLGYGDGAFNQETDSPFGISSGGIAVTAGDFNGDGKLDLAIGARNLETGGGGLTILLGNGDGTFTAAPASTTSVALATSIAVADFNGDGKLDLAVTNSANNNVSVLLGNGDGTFTEAPGSPVTVGTQPNSVAVGDFTGSGKLALATANYLSNDVTLLLGNGDGTFTQPAGSPIAVGKGPFSIAVGDFNGAGRLGLAVANITDGTVSVLLQQ